LLNKRLHPELTPWVPPKPTLLEGIFFYQKTHMEELQMEKTKNTIRQVFIDTGITPFEDGRWNQYRRERFTNHRKISAANHILSNVLKLQDKKCISAYLFNIGLDDQDPSQWDDVDLLTIHRTARRRGKRRLRRRISEEKEEEVQTLCRVLWFLILSLHRTARRRRRRRRHRKDPGDRRRSVS